MAQSQFALSWESYETNICSGFSYFQQNGELVDMTLAADGHLVKVHQVLIALASPYLKEMITAVPTQHPVVFLNNISYTTLSLILEYIYTGEVRLPAENLSSFMESAKALHIRGLESITDSGNTTKRMDTNMNGTSLDNTRIRKKSDQIILPPDASKINVDVIPDSSAMVSVQKPLVDSHDGDMHDYSGTVDDMLNDFDVDDDNHSKIQTPAKTGNNKSIKSSKVSADNSKVGSNLQFTVSIRGALQVILNRYIYNLHSSRSGGIRRWRCTNYRYRDKKKCSAFITTKGNIVLNRANPHNHPFHDKKILAKLQKNAIYSALDEVQDLAIVKDKNKNITEDSMIVSVTDHFTINK